MTTTRCYQDEYVYSSNSVEPHYDENPLRRQGVRHYDENVKVGDFHTDESVRRSGLGGGCDTTTKVHNDEKRVRMWGTKWQTDAG